MNKTISLRIKFSATLLPVDGKTFSFTPDETKVQDLLKASVAENNLLCY